MGRFARVRKFIGKLKRLKIRHAEEENWSKKKA